MRRANPGKLQRAREEYNPLGKVTRETDPLGRETILEYDSNGIDQLRVKQKNQASPGGYDLLKSRTYNSQHRVLTATDAAGQTTTYTYRPTGDVETVVTPPRNGLSAAERQTTYEYFADTAPSGAGRLKKLTGPSSPSGSPSTTYEYDGYGRVWKTAGSLGDPITSEYDALDRIRKTTYPDGTFSEVTYDRLDPSGYRDRSDKWTRYFYDALRRPVAVRNPAGRTTTRQWCTCGSLDKLIDGNGNAIIWERDLQGRVTKGIRADSTFRSYIYETTTSHLKQVIDAKQQVKGYEYFLDDEIKQITYTNAQVPTANNSFTYRPVDGQLATLTDGTGTTTYTYHPAGSLGAGRRASVDGPLADDVVTYEYDELGRLKSRRVNGTANSLTQVYDALGRVTSVSNVLGTFAFGYLGVTGRLSTITYPNGQTVTHTYYDVTGGRRRAEIHNKRADGSTLSKFGYSYGPVGNVSNWSTQIEALPPSALALGYDAADALITATRTPPDPTLPDRFVYVYDQGGNRLVEQRDDAAMGASFNAINELTSQQPGGALLFRGSLNEPSSVTVAGNPAEVSADNVFAGSAPVGSGTSTVTVTAKDTSGNLRTNVYQVEALGITRAFTYDANGNLTSDGTRTFEWDADDRLVAINESGTLRTEFTYDHSRRRTRILEKSNGTVTSTKLFVWSMTEPLEERDSTGNVTKRFFSHGTQVGGTNLYYAKDHLGSVRELADTGGTVRARYDYDAWGRVTKLSGDLDSDFRFTGHYFHAPSGLHLAVHRVYDADVGRWLSRDPLKKAELRQGPNLYQYAFSDPVNRIDPLGLDAPRCDKIPDFPMETPCTLECCARHDKCYDDHDCGYSSWVCPYLTNPCQKCNIKVVLCFFKCVPNPYVNDPEAPDCYDDDTHQPVECPPPNIPSGPGPAPGPDGCWRDSTGELYCW